MYIRSFSRKRLRQMWRLVVQTLHPRNNDIACIFFYPKIKQKDTCSIFLLTLKTNDNYANKIF